MGRGTVWKLTGSRLPDQRGGSPTDGRRKAGGHKSLLKCVARQKNRQIWHSTFPPPSIPAPPHPGKYSNNNALKRENEEECPSQGCIELALGSAHEVRRTRVVFRPGEIRWSLART